MELVRLHSRGGFSVRSFIAFCLAVLIAAFFLTTLGATSAQAQTPEPGTWKSEVILFNNHAYQPASSTLSSSHGLPADTSIYIYTPPAAGSASAQRTAYFIYFAPGVDPSTATSAELATYTLRNDTFSNKRDIQTIEMTPLGEESDYSSCNVSGGLGWIICPVTVFLANAMDSLFDVMANMIAVQPLSVNNTGSDNGIYTAWNMTRNIANIAFVIAFLILIYAQITSFGVSNYGMKKMIPRLVIAAIMVNASFIVTAVAIDISNILGFSVQDVFVGIRENLFYMTDDTVGLGAPTSTGADNAFNSGAWTNMATGILAGTGVIVAGGLAISNASLFFIVPLLLGLLATVLLVIIVLAARQAIIIVLIIIAPLAFVANLLPNTEKWFEKWRDLFMTMLIFFPAFSLVFGGSQLAGQIIIQNAGTNLIMILFGMAVQVAPLVVTPLLLKLSGSLLGRIAQLVNNPQKGALDRSKNWAKARQEKGRNHNIGRNEMNKRSKYNPLKVTDAMVRKQEFRKRNLKGSGEVEALRATNAYEQSKGAHKIHDNMDIATADKDYVHNKNAARTERNRQNQSSRLYDRAIRAQVSKDELETQQQHTAGHYSTLRTVGGTPLNTSNNNLEASKANAEAAGLKLNAYLHEQRTFQSTELGSAAVRLERAKLNSEGWDSKYKAHIDDLKIKPNTTLNTAAAFAQSSKEHAEASQNTVQTMFERERQITGTQLNKSMLKLEDTKLEMSEAQSMTSVLLNNAKSEFDGVLHIRNTQSELAKYKAQNSEAQLKSVLEEYKAGHVPAGASAEMQSIINSLGATQQSIAVENDRASNASQLQTEQFADALMRNAALRDRAGGIRGKEGADAVMASAINTVRAAYGKSVTEAREIIKHFNLSSDQRQDLALGVPVTVTKNGISHTFHADDTFARESAIEDQIAVGTITQVEELVKRSGIGEPLADFRTTIAASLAKNGLGGKSLYLGGKTIDDVGKGTVTGDEGILALAVESIGKGKIAPKDLASIDPLAVKRLLEAARSIQSGVLPAGVTTDMPTLQKKLAAFSEAARKTLTGDESDGVKEAAKDFLEQAGQITDSTFTAPRS